MRPNSLAVIGLGAMGGSLAWQARLAGVPSVIGYAADRSDGVQALKAGAIHDLAESAVRAAATADLVVLAVPPKATQALLGELAGQIRSDALITDVASIKQPIVARAREVGLAERFAGSHPFTGTHVTGWPGARGDRYRRAIVYVCPTGPEGEAAAREIRDFWSGVLEADPVAIDPVAHDDRLAWTSHLPQAVASVLAEVLGSEPSLRGAAFGSGARDTTRLAASGAELWVEILLANREPLQRALGRMEVSLIELDRLLKAGDRAGLTALLERAASFRRSLDSAG